MIRLRHAHFWNFPSEIKTRDQRIGNFLSEIEIRDQRFEIFKGKVPLPFSIFIYVALINNDSHALMNVMNVM